MKGIITMIINGGEPFFMKGGPHGILLIHGFTGVPAEMLTETTEEALKEQAEAILRFAGRDKYPVIKDGGEARRLCKKTTAEQFSEWASTQFK